MNKFAAFTYWVFSIGVLGIPSYLFLADYLRSRGMNTDGNAELLFPMSLAVFFCVGACLALLVPNSRLIWGVSSTSTLFNILFWIYLLAIAKGETIGKVVLAVFFLLGSFWLLIASLVLSVVVFLYRWRRCRKRGQGV